MSTKACVDKLQHRLSAIDRLSNSVEDLKKSQVSSAFDRAQAVHHASVNERLDYLEGLIGDSVEKHAKEVAELKASHDKHAVALSRHAKDLDQYKGGGQVHHASIEERLNYVERMIGDSADKHANELAAAQTKLEALQNRLQSVDRQAAAPAAVDVQRAHSAVASLKTTLDDRHNSLQERVDYLERQLGDSAEKHARELKALKDAHGRHARDLESVKSNTKHASVEERLDYVEKAIGDSADKHAAELAAAHSKLEQMHGRLLSCESHANTVGELRKAHSGLSSDKNSWEMSHASLKERVDHLDMLLGEAGEKHGKGLEAALAKLDQLNSRLAACERTGAALSELKRSHSDLTHGKASIEAHHASLKERMDYVERLLGDSAEKHTKELEAIRFAHDRHLASLTKCSKDLESVKAAHSQHSSMGERLSLLERALGDLSHKHSQEVSAMSQKAELLHSKLAEETVARERHHSSIRDLISKDRDHRESHHATVKQRVEFLESLVGDNADKHARELAETKAVTAKVAAELKNTSSSAHGSIADRLDKLERSHGESFKKLSDEMASTHSRIDQLYSRMTVVKDAWITDAPHSPTSPSLRLHPTSPTLGRRMF
jgi:chromosome segregation ATPase